MNGAKEPFEIGPMNSLTTHYAHSGAFHPNCRLTWVLEVLKHLMVDRSP